MPEANEPLVEYRKHLVSLQEKMQAEYDKTVIALSGGAFGISIAFSKDIVGNEKIVSSGWLVAAWLGWGLSVTVMLASFFTSSLAMERAIKQTDQKFLWRERVGGEYDQATRTLNIVGGLLFFIGVICMTVFVAKNLN